MPRRCGVCHHTAVAQIDSDIVSGMSFRSVAARFDVSKAAVGRHAKHLRQRLSAEAVAAMQPSNVVECLPPAPQSLVAFFRDRRVEQLSPRATVRQSGLHDIRRLETLIDAGIESGRADLVLHAIKLKTELLCRLGLMDHAERPLFTWTEYEGSDEQDSIFARMNKADRMTAMFRRFAVLTNILPSPDDIPDLSASDTDGPALDGFDADHAHDMDASDTDGDAADDNDPSGPIVDGEAAGAGSDDA